MESKSLKIVQGFAKFFKIISKICFVVCIVSGSLSLTGFICFVLGKGSVINIGKVDVSLDFFNDIFTTNDMNTAICGMLLVLICSVAYLFVFKYTTKYFVNEMDDGTPFTFEGSKEILHLGIIWISVSIGCSIVSGIIISIANSFEDVSSSVDLDFSRAVWIGFILIVLSFIFKYGAELEEKNQ